MQVKKFEAPTIQEALDTIKRELGPEAIILQTKKNKRGFGLLSKASVEITAAVSDRSLQKKQYVETRLPENNREAIKKLPANRQAELYNKFTDKHLERVAKNTRDRVEMSSRAAVKAASSSSGATVALEPGEPRRITATRYIDIDESVKEVPRREITIEEAIKPKSAIIAAPAPVGAAIGKLNTSGSGSGMSVEEELRHLKRIIEEMKNVQDAKDEGSHASGAQALMNQGALATGALQDAFEQLVIGGVDKRYAQQLVKKVAFELGADRAKDPDSVADQLAVEIMGNTEVMSLLGDLTPKKPEGRQQGPTVIALVGPTGVGKTTTVAKMASEALLKQNLKVGLINLDNYKVAAFDQLGTYAKILNVPFRSVSSRDDLKAAIQDFQSLDLILIDTTGRSQRDPESLKEMHSMLSAIPNVRTELMLSVTTRDTELYDMAKRFAIFHPEGLMMSKLDEATIYGAIYNVSQKMKLPLLYFTTGQRVPEDIEEATRERVAALILNI